MTAHVDKDEIPIRDSNGEPWFVGKDIAERLGYTNPQKAVRDHIDEEDKTLNESFTVNGTPIVLINESGLEDLSCFEALKSLIYIYVRPTLSFFGGGGWRPARLKTIPPAEAGRKNFFFCLAILLLFKGRLL